ncbi:MFS transporter [Kribbella sp. NBC_00709]|uniref:MFS transporter n=1 Tax=Kribbella sp. NBC_00709 TaxID=2975972 RepID=UPI002E2A2CC4|nr:MFS transporter [Kribbella sp. NBC_00709]
MGTLFAEGRERNRAFSIWGAAGGSGMALGSLLGGVLTQAFGWPAIFFVNVPLAAVGVVAALMLIPVDHEDRGARRFDVPSSAPTSAAGWRPASACTSRSPRALPWPASALPYSA